MDNEIVSLPVNENDEGAIAQTQRKPTDHKTDNNNESMDEDNYVSQNPTCDKRQKKKKKKTSFSNVFRVRPIFMYVNFLQRQLHQKGSILYLLLSP